MSDILVPQLGESVVEARVAKWLKREGERVETGEPVVELETDKIDLEVGANHSGVLSSIKHREGEDVKVGEVLAVITDGAEASRPAATPTPAPAREASTPAVAQPSPAVPGERRAPAPAPARTAAPVTVAESPPPAPAAPRITTEPEAMPTAPARRSDRREERVRMSKRRATIARRLVEAQRTAAMLTTFNEIDMTVVMELRKKRREAFEKEYGVGLGLMSFFVKASIAALRAFPQLNAEIQGDEVVYKHYFDIGIAVGAEGGLVVPVLRNADQMSFAEIEAAIRDFAARAEKNTLTLEDLTGGTFTITNGGVFGSLMSTPILNPPQVGILGLHKIQDRAVPLNGQVVIRPMMYVALSYDHRLVDGREAVQFLVRIKSLVEDPANLLLVS
jgi:2-oxoglutarate dehydrogenase E2 component (dihydrolipoamide succinyltransferase)